MLKNKKFVNSIYMGLFFVLSVVFSMMIFRRSELSSQVNQLKEVLSNNINVIVLLSVIAGIGISVLFLVEYYIGKLLLYLFFKDVKPDFMPYVLPKILVLSVNLSLLSAFNIYNTIVFSILAVIAGILAMTFHYTKSNKIIASLLFTSPLLLDSLLSLAKVLF
jgi:hypothetical protein